MRNGAGTDENFSEVSVIEICSKLRHAEIVGSKRDDHIGRDGRMPQLVIIPNDAGCVKDLFVYLLQELSYRNKYIIL